KDLQKELVSKLPDQKNLPTEPFTEEAMLSAWNEYNQKMSDEGNYNLHSHLSMGVPKLEGTLLHLEFPNNTIKTEVERARHKLLGFLREQLNNYSIDLSIEVNEAEVKRYAYTPKEKYEKLMEKNPLLDKLRKEFDLEI
ncbi:MAG: DNA polymerase III subunit gamma/tau, partial [Flavobacteriaceae bacterium]|nr:DNA polymerase III subunit gamma/tau [Flavobacteriaceae bacterium]